jgi:CheY-like chemotaxis protein
VRIIARLFWAVVVRLPRARSCRAAVNADAVAVILGGDGMGGRVLVVDDDPDVLRLARRVLEQHGYTVDTASDGVEALAQITREPPDLLLTDLWMPRLDGLSLVYQLRQRGVAFPILLFSATYEVELPGIPFLRKPFHVNQLVQAVADAIGAPRS